MSVLRLLVTLNKGTMDMVGTVGTIVTMEDMARQTPLIGNTLTTMWRPIFMGTVIVVMMVDIMEQVDMGILVVGIMARVMGTSDMDMDIMDTASRAMKLKRRTLFNGIIDIKQLMPVRIFQRV